MHTSTEVQFRDNWPESKSRLFQQLIFKTYTKSMLFKITSSSQSFAGRSSSSSPLLLSMMRVILYILCSQSGQTDPRFVHVAGFATVERKPTL